MFIDRIVLTQKSNQLLKKLWKTLNIIFQKPMCILDLLCEKYFLRVYNIICSNLLAFSDKVIRIIPGDSNELDFLSSLEGKQELEVR